MRSIFLRLAIVLVRSWTRAYTAWVTAPVRRARRAEIDSDLWEQLQAEADSPLLAVRILGRLVAGMFDDIRWGLEAATWRPKRAAAALMLASGAAVLAYIWVAQASPASAPRVPPVQVRWERTMPLPPPPPPPPPLCNPPGSGRPPITPCTPWP